MSKTPPLVFQAARDAAGIDSLAKALDAKLPPETRDTLARYAELVAKWNAQLDLTAARDATAMTEILFADALVLAREDLAPKKSRVVDVGTGAGAPGLPLAILRPDLDVTLVEPLRKRIAFLRTAFGTLDVIDRVRAIETRIEETDEAPTPRGFDVAISRATYAPEIWLGIGLRLAPRVLVLTAGDDPPADAGAVQIAHAHYSIPSTRAPRRITAYGRRQT